MFGFVLVSLLAPAVGCNDDPTSPPFSVEAEINLNSPYDRVTIHVDGTVRVDTGSDAGRHYYAVRAEDGLLVLEMSDGDTLVFNLTLACAIEIGDATLILRY